MLLRALTLLALSLLPGYACSCTSPSVDDKLARASAVFRGTITGFRDAIAHTDEGDIPYKIAVFRVSRVWKGDLGATVEMLGFEETTACVGFWPSYLKVETDLLVYAIGKDVYGTDICGNHMLAKDAAKD